MERRTYRAGQTILLEGGETSEAYLIHAGQVTVSRGDQRLRTLGPGDIFGEMALVTDQPRSATVTALTDVEVGVIDRDEFETMWRTDPASLIPLIRMLCDRVRGLNALVHELAHQSTHSRDTVVAHQVSDCAAGETPTRVYLVGATSEARASLGAETRVIDRFPFRIGRVTVPGDALSVNDLCLRDVPPFHVSRNHCVITRAGDRVFVIDRGSRLGTVVGYEKVGNGGTPRAELRRGTTELALGGQRSPYRYRVTVS
jgi:CRP/FNR family cyclic AMP-dependent transcriptional regulator